MSGNSILLDSNIILYLLSGDASLAHYLQPRTLFISVITEIELLSFQKLSNSEEKSVRALLSAMRIVSLDETIKEESIRLRRANRLKLPDAIIAATATSLHLPLMTADQQFQNVSELALELYQPS